MREPKHSMSSVERTFLIVLAVLCSFFGLSGLFTGHVFAVGKYGGEVDVAQQPFKYWLVVGFYAVSAAGLMIYLIVRRTK